MIEIKKILLPCDLTTNASKILPYVRSVAEKYNSMILLLHVVENIHEQALYPYPGLGHDQKIHEKDAEKKLKKAYTGGSILADFQRENGGVFDICPIYNLRANHFEPEYDLKDRCSSGDLLCGYCKKDAITEVLQYLSEHQAKLEDAKSRIDEYLLKTPIRSIL